MDVEEADGPHAPCAEEQGTVFKDNVAVMRDTLHDMAPPSLDAAPRAEPLLAIPRAELPHVEVPFSPFVDQRSAELSVNLQGEIDGHETGLSGDHSPERQAVT